MELQLIQIEQNHFRWLICLLVYSKNRFANYHLMCNAWNSSGLTFDQMYAIFVTCGQCELVALLTITMPTTMMTVVMVRGTMYRILNRGVSESDLFIHYLIKLVDIFDCWAKLQFSQFHVQLHVVRWDANEIMYNCFFFLSSHTNSVVLSDWPSHTIHSISSKEACTGTNSNRHASNKQIEIDKGDAENEMCAFVWLKWQC